jgi:hypothetical protein
MFSGIAGRIQKITALFFKFGELKKPETGRQSKGR